MNKIIHLSRSLNVLRLSPLCKAKHVHIHVFNTTCQLRPELSGLGRSMWTYSQPDNGLRVKTSITSHPCLVTPSRTYAKGKDKKGKGKGKKGKGDSGKPKVQLSHDDLNSIVNFDKYQDQLNMVLDQLQLDFSEALKLRTSSDSLDSVMVETPDGKFPLIQLASIQQKNPQLLVVELSAVPQYINNVKTAIAESGMNLNPQQDGTTLFVPVPKVTREHREGLAKNAKQLTNKAKDKIRDVQNRFLKDLKKSKDNFSEDLVFATQNHVMAASHEYTDKAESLLLAKQKELIG